VTKITTVQIGAMNWIAHAILSQNGRVIVLDNASPSTSGVTSMSTVQTEAMSRAARTENAMSRVSFSAVTVNACQAMLNAMDTLTVWMERTNSIVVAMRRSSSNVTTPVAACFSIQSATGTTTAATTVTRWTARVMPSFNLNAVQVIQSVFLSTGNVTWCLIVEMAVMKRIAPVKQRIQSSCVTMVSVSEAISAVIYSVTAMIRATRLAAHTQRARRRSFSVTTVSVYLQRSVVIKSPNVSTAPTNYNVLVTRRTSFAATPRDSVSNCTVSAVGMRSAVTAVMKQTALVNPVCSSSVSRDTRPRVFHSIKDVI